MIKCLLIYLWIYIGLFYMIEAGDDDEHVHIKLHMTGGQRKRAQMHQHTHSHHKKRHTSSSPHHQHRHHQQHHSHPLPPPVATTATNLYHESPPHNYLTGITATSSSSLLPQNHVFQTTHKKKFPSSSPLNLHESGQLLNMEEDVFGQDVGGDAVVSVDTDDGEPMTIPSYVTKKFALFPQPTTTYETEIIPHNSEGFNAVSEGFAGLEYGVEEDNEITPPAGRGKGSLESIILAEHMDNYQRHKPSSSSSAYSTSSSPSAKTIKNEKFLQQLLQQQHNEQPEIINAGAYKSAKHRANKQRSENDYHSENDMTEAMMYLSSAMGTRHNSAQSFKRPAEDAVKALTVDDIWSQLQQQYLNKYSPQAQPLISGDSDEQPFTTTPTKTKPKRKRNTKRQRHAKPTKTSTYSTSWPAKSLSYSPNRHHSKLHLQPIQQQQQQQHYYDAIHLAPSAAAFSSTSLSSHRDTDFFPKRPFNKLNNHSDDDDTDESDEDSAAEFAEDGEGYEGNDDNDDDDDDDDFDAYGDESFEEAVYQRGKKFTGHTAYGQHSHTNNPFSNYDLYGSFSTPITATVATNIQPSTYHPHSVSSTLPSYTSTTANTFLPTLSQPSTSYQWRTQQSYPSYQTYHLQHQRQQQQQQQQPPQWTANDQYALQHSTTLGLQTPSSKLSPTQSNEFSVSSSTSSAAKSTVQPPARYKKRKNRIKPKRNRIVVI